MKMTMLANISWSNYIIAVIVLLVIWYLVLILKFYYKDLKKIISGEKKFTLKPKSSNSERNGKSLSSTFSESFDNLEDAEELSKKLLQVIKESSDQNYSKEAFQNYLRIILSDYPFVKISSLRENINNFIVSECEKHPLLHLTSSQVEGLWEEAI